MSLNKLNSILFISLGLVMMISCITFPDKENSYLMRQEPADTTAETSGPVMPAPATVTEKKIWKDKIFKLPYISAVKATFPLRIYRLNFNAQRGIINVDEKVRAAIEQEIRKCYFINCGGDSSEEFSKMKDVYFNTICLKDSLQTIFMVLTHCCIPDWVGSTVFFYDNLTHEFAGTTFDFNLHPLYVLRDTKLETGNLKDHFLKRTPEIGLIDYDGDGINDYKFTRLYHNGTVNAIETTILKVRNKRVETLYFNQEGVGLGFEKPD
jgi:hypothetical protein